MQCLSPLHCREVAAELRTAPVGLNVAVLVVTLAVRLVLVLLELRLAVHLHVLASLVLVLLCGLAEQRPALHRGPVSDSCSQQDVQTSIGG